LIGDDHRQRRLAATSSLGRVCRPADLYANQLVDRKIPTDSNGSSATLGSALHATGLGNITDLDIES